MPYELTNTLTTFMPLIDDVSHPQHGKFIVNYLDDILIFSGMDHMEHVYHEKYITFMQIAGQVGEIQLWAMIHLLFGIHHCLNR